MHLNSWLICSCMVILVKEIWLSDSHLIDEINLSEAIYPGYAIWYVNKCVLKIQTGWRADAPSCFIVDNTTSFSEKNELYLDSFSLGSYFNLNLLLRYWLGLIPTIFENCLKNALEVLKPHCSEMNSIE